MAGVSSLLLCAVFIVLITCTEAEDFQCIHERNPKVGYVYYHQFELYLTIFTQRSTRMEKASKLSQHAVAFGLFLCMGISEFPIVFLL